MLVGMEIRLGYDVVDRVLADLGDTVDILDLTRRRAAADVEALLDGGWSGAAAEAFAEAWQQWSAGAEQVGSVLASMVAVVATTRSDLAATDDAIAAASQRLLERVGR